jgi:hypothetical protein
MSVDTKDKATAADGFRYKIVTAFVLCVACPPSPLLSFVQSAPGEPNYSLLRVAFTFLTVLAVVCYVALHREVFIGSPGGALWLLALSAFAMCCLSYLPEAFLGPATFMYGQPIAFVWQVIVSLPAIFVWYKLLKLIFKKDIGLLRENATRANRRPYYAFVILAIGPLLADLLLWMLIPRLHAAFAQSDLELPVKRHDGYSISVATILDQLSQPALSILVLIGVLLLYRYRFRQAITSPLMIVLFFIVLFDASLPLITKANSLMILKVFRTVLFFPQHAILIVLNRMLSALLAYWLLQRIFGTDLGLYVWPLNPNTRNPL